VIVGDKAYASRWTFYIGKDGKILYIDKAVSPASHGQEVLARLKALGIQ
jgi:thioredoxin-dependent peroxiredoxin